MDKIREQTNRWEAHACYALVFTMAVVVLVNVGYSFGWAFLFPALISAFVAGIRVTETVLGQKFEDGTFEYRGDAR